MKLHPKVRAVDFERRRLNACL